LESSSEEEEEEEDSGVLGLLKAQLWLDPSSHAEVRPLSRMLRPLPSSGACSLLS
jgi:hypothetical protein